jgi:hypothetical protein
MSGIPLKLPSSFPRTFRALFLLTFFVITSLHIAAQNVGIGTNNPTRKLSVAGSIVVDHDTTADGTLEGSALLFGREGVVGITSSRAAGSQNIGGLDFHTYDYPRLRITSTGLVGVNVLNPTHTLHVGGSFFATANVHAGNTVTGNDIHATAHLRAGVGAFNGSHELEVFGGTRLNGYLLTSENITGFANLTIGGYSSLQGGLRVDGLLDARNTMRVTERTAIGGDVDPAYRLRVYDGNARVGGDFHATGIAAIGGETDPAFKLRVWGGNSRFGGDVEVTGSMNVSQINNKGVVTSNGASSLRIGFNEQSFTYNGVGSGETRDITVSLPAFEGGNDDIRVSVAQFVPDPLPQYAFWFGFNFHVHSVDAATNTAKIRITNMWQSPLSIKGTIHIMSVAKN